MMDMMGFMDKWVLYAPPYYLLKTIREMNGT